MINRSPLPEIKRSAGYIGLPGAVMEGFWIEYLGVLACRTILVQHVQ